jgi:hypothetical protein
VLGVTRHRVPPALADRFQAEAGDVLAVLAERPGFVRGRVARATDDAELWLLVTEWADVGSYRRAVGALDVRLRAGPLLAGAVDEPTGFEVLTALEAGGSAVTTASARARDADLAGPGDAPSRPVR